MTDHHWSPAHPRFDEKRDTEDVIDDIEEIANEMGSVVDELEAAAERKDYRDVDSQFTELRSLFESLDEKHDDLPAVPEVA